MDLWCRATVRVWSSVRMSPVRTYLCYDFVQAKTLNVNTAGIGILLNRLFSPKIFFRIRAGTAMLKRSRVQARQGRCQC